jgi:hypothetical protein
VVGRGGEEQALAPQDHRWRGARRTSMVETKYEAVSRQRLDGGQAAAGGLVLGPAGQPLKRPASLRGWGGRARCRLTSVSTARDRQSGPEQVVPPLAPTAPIVLGPRSTPRGGGHPRRRVYAD